RVADIMTEISAASEEQSAGIEEVNRAITQMDEMTQQNAALVEEAAAAAQSMQDQATRLAEAVDAFKIAYAAASVQPAARPAPVMQAAGPQVTAPARVAAKLPASSARAPKAVAPARRGKPAAGDDWEEF
ncbi:MAG TPA: hypothetical protein VM406_06615, partial [Noviherbaspirillum sp.]|nr:hypothetical protein [Noviherbaspirillum sp.]